MTTSTAASMRHRSYAVADAITMLRRSLLHIIRYPGLAVFVIALPVVFLLLFVFVFGGALGAGLPGVDPASGRSAYLAYLMPGIIAMAIAGTAGGLATTVSMDMTEGITARLRTMSIARGSILAGHVLGNVIQAVLAVAILLAVGLACGFRPSAGLTEWLALAGIVLLIAFAISWIGVAMGIQAKSVETASNWPLVLLMLPFLSSGFVPVESLPGWMQSFAEYQPFTAFIETMRALLTGSDPGNYPALAIGWSVVLTALGFVWALVIFERKSVR
jgi:ABC-2 type transport system permease protein